MSNYEKTGTNQNHKFESNWNLPARVIQLKERAVIVKTWDNIERQVPISRIHKLVGEIHPLMQQFNLKQIKFASPFKKSLPLTESVSNLWGEFLNDSKAPSEELKVTKKRNNRKSEILNMQLIQAVQLTV